MNKFRYEIVGRQGYSMEHRWIFHDSADAMAFAQMLLATHKPDNDDEDGPYEVSVEIYAEDDNEGVN